MTVLACRPPAGIHPPVLAFPRVQQLQRRVAQRAGQRSLQLSRQEGPVQLHHQATQRAAGEAGGQQPHKNTSGKLICSALRSSQDEVRERVSYRVGRGEAPMRPEIM